MPQGTERELRGLFCGIRAPQPPPHPSAGSGERTRLSQPTRGCVPWECGEHHPAGSFPFPTRPTGGRIKDFSLSWETGCRLVEERIWVGKAGGCLSQGPGFGGDSQVSPHHVAPDTRTLLGCTLSYRRLSIPHGPTQTSVLLFCVLEPGCESSHHLSTGHCWPVRRPHSSGFVRKVCGKVSWPFLTGGGRNLCEFFWGKVSSLLWDSAAFQAPE